MCDYQTWIFAGPEFELHSHTTTTMSRCVKDPLEQEECCVFPVCEDVYTKRGGPDEQLHFRVVVVPGHWDEATMRESIHWWGNKP